MPKVIYEIGGVSADGYIEELHRFHNEQTRALAGHRLGRGLYETMVYWETADKDPSDIVREFALIWQALPKVVFSRRHGTGRDVHVQLARRVLEIPRGRPLTLRRADCAPTGARDPAHCSSSQRLKELLGQRARHCGRPRVSQ